MEARFTFANPRAVIQSLMLVLASKFLLSTAIGTELEFYLVDCDNQPATPEQAAAFLYRIAAHDITYSKEKGKGQYEIAIDYTTELNLLCNKILQVKRLLKDVATHANLSVTFAPKPFSNDYGSASHYHISLHKDDGYNIFQTGGIDDNTSLQHTIAGLLELINQSLYIFTAGDNSEFARFVPHFTAPTHISWGGNNRTTVIRIPESSPQHRRIEFRLPSAASLIENAIIFLLTAIIYGLENKQKPMPRIYGNANHPQYNLIPLWTNNIEAKKHFHFDQILANYI